ncbi:unnamed protein product [Musa hybrid cultivar]
MEQHHRTASLSLSSSSSFAETMEKRQLNQEKTEGFMLLPSLSPNLFNGPLICAEEVSNTERKLTDMSEEEVDLIYRMHRLVGDRWELIAGRIPGRTPEEIKRFWKMKNDPCFSEKGLKRKRAVQGTVAQVQNHK